MKSKEKLTLQELLKDKVIIPAIQRDYAFGRKNFEATQKRKNFIANLVNVVNGKQNKLHLDFVYGKKMGETFIPLDGQQRITTLWLLSVYLSKKNKVDNSFLEQFSYATRTGTREFCESLITEDWNPDEVSVEYFQKQKWFFNSWRYDPTISGMLVVLEEIHEQLLDGGDYINMKNITFSFLDVDELGQPEELYVKMNSRGKQLSEWDNFKAELFELPSSNRYKEWIDTEFLDYFWRIGYDGEDKAAYTEKRMLRFFFLNLFIVRILSSESTESSADEILNQIRANWKCMVNEDFLSSLHHFIELLKSKSEDIKDYQSTRFESIRFDELMTILSNKDIDGFTADLDLYFSYWCYLSQVDNESFNIEELFNVIRITSNFEESYRKYVEVTRPALKAFKTAIEWPEGILDWFANGDLSSITFGARSDEQKYEEVIKAKLLLGEDGNEWKDLIYLSERHPYFKGTIGWLLRLSDRNIENFKNYSNWMLYKFDENGLKDRTEIAEMLKYSDIRVNRFFPKNNSDVKDSYRDWSWKRYFRERGYKEKLESYINIDWMKEWYAKEFIDISTLDNWRQWVINYPKILNHIGAIDVEDGTIFGLVWRVRAFNSNKYSIPILVAKCYIGGFEYYGNMNAKENTVTLEKDKIRLSFDNAKNEFLILSEEEIISRISVIQINESIEKLQGFLNGASNLGN